MLSLFGQSMIKHNLDFYETHIHTHRERVCVSDIENVSLNLILNFESSDLIFVIFLGNS